MKKSCQDSSNGSKSGIVREGIFGLNDGLVATIGLVSGEALSHQSHFSIVIASLSAISANMVSMAVGSFLATASENDFMRKEIADQARAIRQYPRREKHHVARLLTEIGLPDPAVPVTTARIVRDGQRWIRFMAREHLGIHAHRSETPLKNALVMGIAVVLGSAPPVLPYLLPLSLVAARNLSWATSLAAAASLGAAKALATRTALVKSLLSFSALVSLSALVGALIGAALGSLRP
ncbi:MAG: iron transporter [Sulfobacillus acidophilus]|uniref:Iron transporter n=1 Tax=Sulfobacillus acidophilus TaxID=53633 RepID=A0A2T2WHT8_9FIRM|nr:MAG: iron transporter [Sulfobacillus acidophilus]